MKSLLIKAYSPSCWVVLPGQSNPAGIREGAPQTKPRSRAQPSPQGWPAAGTLLRDNGQGLRAGPASPLQAEIEEAMRTKRRSSGAPGSAAPSPPLLGLRSGVPAGRCW